MVSMLEELYYGNIRLNRMSGRNLDYQKAMRVISDNEETLMKSLEDKERKLFIDYEFAQGQVNGITSVEQFVDGFRLGALMMAEVFTRQDELLIDA